MSELHLIKSESFGEVQADIYSNGNEMFMTTRQLYECLEESKQAFSNRLNRNEYLKEPEFSGVHKMLTPSGQYQETRVFTEDGIYEITMLSESPKAQEFRRWIRGVLKSLRKHGGYIANQENMTSEQILANAVILAKNVIADKDKKILELAPKAAFFDAVADSKSAIEMGAVAKVLAIPGYGRNNLFEFLRDKGVLQENNVPYQKHVDAGRFRVIEQKYVKPDGSTNISIKTLVYQKGADYIRRLITDDNMSIFSSHTA